MKTFPRTLRVGERTAYTVDNGEVEIVADGPDGEICVGVVFSELMHIAEAPQEMREAAIADAERFAGALCRACADRNGEDAA